MHNTGLAGVGRGNGREHVRRAGLVDACSIQFNPYAFWQAYHSWGEVAGQASGDAGDALIIEQAHPIAGGDAAVGGVLRVHLQAVRGSLLGFQDVAALRVGAVG